MFSLVTHLVGGALPMQDYDATTKKCKSEMKAGLALIDTILKKGAVSNANLRMLIDEIVLNEKDNKLSLTIRLKANFQRHLDVYDEDGSITDKLFETVVIHEESEECRRALQIDF